MVLSLACTAIVVPSRTQINRFRPREGSTAVPSAPPLPIREPDASSPLGPFFFLCQRGLAGATEPRRLAHRPKSVSEPPASLFERTCMESVRIQKALSSQRVGFLAGSSSWTMFITLPCGQRHPRWAYLCVAVRATAEVSRGLRGGGSRLRVCRSCPSLALRIKRDHLNFGSMPAKMRAEAFSLACGNGED